MMMQPMLDDEMARLRAELAMAQALNQDQAKQLADQAKQLADQAKQIDDQAKQLADQAKQIDDQAKQLADQAKQLADQASLIRQMQDQIRRLLRGRFGAKTEAMIGAQVGQQLIDGVAGLLSQAEQDAANGMVSLPVIPVATSADATSADATSTDAVVVPVPPKRTPRRGAPWSQRHPDLPVETIVLQPDATELVDGDGRLKVKIGEEVTETLSVEAPKVLIRRTIRPRYASASTGDERVIAALPARITAAGSLDDSTVHWLMSQRYGFSFPFARSLTLLEQMGIRLPASTVGDAAGDWAAVMWPLARAIRRELWHSPLLFVDHAVMRQQDHRLEGKCRRIPVFTATDGHLAWYDAPPTLTNARANELLAGYPGTIIGDDWGGWNPFDPAGCNAHARRPFAELQALSNEARDLVARYARLYAIEADIRQRAGPRADHALWDFRVAERQRLGAPAVMDGIRAAAQVIAERHPKGTTLGNGARYLLRLWPKLTRFLTDGLLVPDNNTAERALRGIALNRKNSLFLGHGDRSADRAAIAWTIFTSCRLQRIDPLAYLADITPELHRWRRALLNGDHLPDLAHLTPTPWAQRKRNHVQHSGAA